MMPCLFSMGYLLGEYVVVVVVVVEASSLFPCLEDDPGLPSARAPWAATKCLSFWGAVFHEIAPDTRREDTIQYSTLLREASDRVFLHGNTRCVGEDRLGCFLLACETIGHHLVRDDQQSMTMNVTCLG